MQKSMLLLPCALSIVGLIAYSNISVQFPASTRDEAITFLEQCIKPNDLVFDIGAHMGNKADLYIACGARVICIEPQPHCVLRLKKRFENNLHVTVEPIGISDKEDTLTMYICNSSTLSTFSQEWIKDGRFSTNEKYTWKNTVQVPVKTLDQMIAKHGLPAFCKIDVENYEYEVLHGLSQPIQMLSFEFHAELYNKVEKCLEHLELLGYRAFNLAVGEHTAFLEPEWVNKETFMAKLYTHREAYPNIWGDIYARHQIN